MEQWLKETREGEKGREGRDGVKGVGERWRDCVSEGRRGRETGEQRKERRKGKHD